MEENLKVDKEYLKAFNLGYELAKELNLKTPIFKDLDQSNDRQNAMHKGMEQYSREMAEQLNKENALGLDNRNSISKEHRDKGKGFNFSI